MSGVARYHGGFRWEGVHPEPYGPELDRPGFQGIVRQRLFGRELGLAAELRYFELDPNGYTRLERHPHAHAVMVMRGRGRVLIGDRIHEIEPFDLVSIGPDVWHQFQADPSTPLGFLCLVDADRDRPRPPSERELEALRRHPELSRFIRS